MAPRSCVGGLTLLSLFLLAAISDAHSSEPSFYSNTCPQATSIINRVVQKIVKRNKNMAGGLLRLHFHDCFVRGCDGSLLLDSSPSNKAEKDARGNKDSLRGFAEIDEIKAALEAECPGIVSCADITALAARDATVMVGGPSWHVALGRKDGLISNKAEAEQKLPSPFATFNELVQNFASVGLSQGEMIVLSGAHTIGKAQCAAVLNRLYDFNGVAGLTDPSLDPRFAKQLKKACPQNSNNVIAMDSTKNKFDEIYFKAVQANKGLFTSDAQLLASPVGKELVSRYSNSGSSFSNDFAAAMEKMGNIQWTSEGEIRRTCSFVNH